MVTLLAAAGPAVLWPGDTPWTNDEPMLITQAVLANRNGRLVTRGLSGNLGLRYGPLPSQIYQALLFLTHDPCTLVALRGLLCAGVTAISLLWLAGTLRFSPWFAATVCLAPNVYLFHRILWDATFIVPIGTLAFAAYASFLKAGSQRSFLLMLASAFALPLIHPQTLPLFTVLIGHLLWRHHSAFWKHRFGVLAVAAVLLTLNGAYLGYAIVTVTTQATQLVRNGQGTRISPLRAAFTPLFAGDILCGDPFSIGDSRLGRFATIVAGARLAASAVQILVWAGMVITAIRTIRSFGRRWVTRENALPNPGVTQILAGFASSAGGAAECSPRRKPGDCINQPDSPFGAEELPAGQRPSRSADRSFAPPGLIEDSQSDPRLAPGAKLRRPSGAVCVDREVVGNDDSPPTQCQATGKEAAAPSGCERSNLPDTVLGVALGGLLLQMLLYAVIRVPPMISYYFGPFPITVLFGWVGIEAFARLRLRGAVIAIYGLCVVTLTFAGAWHVHQLRLAAQLRVADIG